MPFWVLTVGSALGDTLEVGPNGAFPDLYTALAEAGNGDRIEVEPGEYVGPVSIGDKVLEIVSTGGSAVTTLLPFGYENGYYEPSVFVRGSSPVTLRGFTLDARGVSAGMIVDQRGEVIGEDLVFVGGFDRNLIVHQSTVTVRDSLFAGAVGSEAGHAHVYESVVEFERVTFTKGRSGFGGGAAYLTGSSGVFRHCTFADNESVDDGGALRIEAEADDTVTIEDSVFERNASTSGDGGAIIAFGGTLTLLRTAMRDNTAYYGGGAIDHRYATLFRFEDGSVERNTALLAAGFALYDGADAVILRSTFAGNRANDHGGAIGMAGTPQRAEIAGNQFCDNVVGGIGGGIWVDTYGTLVADVHNNVFFGNEAGFAGAAVGVTGSLVEMAQNTIADSSTGGDRGAVWVNYNGAATLVNNAIVYSEGAAGAKEPIAVELRATYTLLFGNDRDLLGTATSDTTVEADPGFREYLAGDCASDLHPADGSALVDAGDPAFLDDDDTRSDIGAYGGPEATTLVDVDGDGLIVGDCAPFDPVASAPGAEVPADGLDQDCDGQDLCYVDADGDGAGSDTTAVAALGCAEDGFAGAPGDCDDEDPARTVDCTVSSETPEPDEVAAGGLPPLWFCSTSGGTPSWTGLAGLAAWFVLRRRRV